jgi:DNA-binding response OmpR family regulator
VSRNILDRYPSGQRGQTVNLLRELRRFKSFSVHQDAQPASARRAVLFSLLVCDGFGFGFLLHVHFISGLPSWSAMRLLLVEDDRALAGVMKRALVEEGYAVDVAGSVLSANEAADLNQYVLVVLDLGLPDGDGAELCRRWRAQGYEFPILMLTARDGRQDRIAGLDAGADDYLVKPFDYGEFAARVRALLRRPRMTRGTSFVVGDVTLDPASHAVWRRGVQVPVTAREFSLLRYLMSRAPDVVERSDLMEQVWDAHYDGLSNTLEVHVASLRRKLDMPGFPTPIDTVRGVGYRMVEAAQVSRR